MRRTLYAKPTIFVLAVVLFFAVHAAWGMYEKSREASQKRDKATAELVELKQREKSLTEDVARLSTDRGVEDEIRNRFMVAKDGEKVMIITSPPDGDVHTVTVTDDKPGIFSQWVAAMGFGGKSGE